MPGFKHPASCFPLEHRIAELEHQCAILRGEPTILGSLTPPTPQSQSAVENAAPVVGVPVQAPVSAESVEFLGSAMTSESFDVGSALFDMEDAADTRGESNAFFLEQYSKLYHELPRFRYEGEGRIPSEEALEAARTEYGALMRQRASSRRPAPFGQDGGLLQRLECVSVVRWGARGRRFDKAKKCYSVSWAGDEHIVEGWQDGSLTVRCVRNGALVGFAHPPEGLRQGQYSPGGALAVAGFSEGNERPTLLARGGLRNKVELLRASSGLQGGLLETQCCLDGHVGYISALRFLAGVGGRELLSGSGDGSAMLWDVTRTVGRHPNRFIPRS